MKSFKDLSLHISEEDYHRLPAWSYSIIARYAKEGFSSIATLYEPVETTPSMEFGSLFDTLITSPDEFDNRYVIMEEDVPASEKKVIEGLASVSSEQSLADIDEQTFTSVMDDLQYRTNWSYGTRKNHILPYNSYYSAVKSGKKFASRKDYEDAVAMKEAFKENKVTSSLFKQEASDTDIEYLYQLKFVVDVSSKRLGDLRIKIMPDLMIVNHIAKTIQLVDLKTSSVPGWQFKENFLKFRYDIQAQLYSDVIEILKNKHGYDEYEILPYIFADISRSDKVPVTYTYPQRDESQKAGFSYTIDGKEYRYKNWKTLLREIIDYENAQAVVPSYITTEETNDLLSIISNKW